MAIVVENKRRSVYFWGAFRNNDGEMGETIAQPTRIPSKDFRNEIV